MTSKPSGTQNHPSGQASSTKSWKTPEPADVLGYAYLWADEAQKWLKDRHGRSLSFDDITHFSA
jgi:hypothetical protein